ncbi:hypothetical protein B0T25DRAFT_563814 [Lasiosphaeria hispida]|uniref:Uncharacterized protein n=1 Tax=Lasiosphaeria hispida TaxID=260671 RepID=A0AAJ0HNW9_9PEZI|nr:hypothetical protein B0T25DRAFT_563814 [Lasiosphaeria hispida]
MARSPRPAALNSLGVTTPTTKTRPSDLPLRNYIPLIVNTNASSTGITLNTPEETPGLSELETPHSVGIAPSTPSSVIVELGDGSRRAPGSAADTVAQVFSSYSRSQPRSGRSEVDDLSRSTPTPRTGRSQSATRLQSTRRKVSITREVAFGERNNSSGHPTVQSPPTTVEKELLAENRSLQQRISALQRTERDLLKDNHELAHQLASFKQHYDTRRRQWRDSYRLKEKAFEARIKDLEAQAAQYEERLAYISPNSPSGDTIVSDADIISWFAERGAAWQSWARDYASRNPNRLRSELHPTQLLELCDSAKGFIRISENKQLPPELLAGLCGNGVETNCIILDAMLSNFIVTEILQSPFWVFAALSNDNLELESPCISRNAVSPVGFRMDLAMWNNVVPLRSAGFQHPVKLSHLAPEPPNARQPPPLITSMYSLTTKTTGSFAATNAFRVPSQEDMEGVYNFLGNIKKNAKDAHTWRSQLARILFEGGIGLNPNDVKGEDCRKLATSRQAFARKLKERFLRGAARFLLQDQDAIGIEELERRLVDELDMALRFSCQIWSRRDPLVFRGLSDLIGTKVHLIE